MFAKRSHIPGGVGLAAAALLVLGLGLSPTPAQAHCKGKHSPPHEHCTDAPAEFNPELVWMEGGTIVIANRDGSNPTSIVDGANPSWSPGGKELLFNRDASNQGPAGVYRLAIFDGDPNAADPRGNFSVETPVLVVESDGWLLAKKSRWSPVPAPDGDYWIAYNHNVVDPMTGETAVEVLLINPTTGDKIQLTETEENYLNFTWSNDATRIAVITVPDDAKLEDIVIHSLTAETDVATGNLVLVRTDSVSVLLHNPAITEPTSNAGMLKQDAVDSSSLESFDWANTDDRLIVTSDGGSGRNRLWIVPVPDVDPIPLQQAVASGTVLALDDDRLEIARVWPSWSPDDTALLYRRFGSGGTCSVPTKKGKNWRFPKALMIGLLDNPDVDNINDDPPGFDDPDKIECDDRPEDEIDLNLDGVHPEWWRGTFPLPPLPLPAL